MVSKGLSDLKVIIGKERVDSMRCILMNGNETFRKLLEDEHFSGELVLCEGSSVDGFIEIEKYYSGGSMELNDENVMKVLLMSIYYNDKEILEICIRYIKNHLNDEMMLRMLELSDLIKKEEIFELIKLSEEYLKENGYKYLNNERLLYKLRIENLRIVLDNENLIINDDTWLLKVLMKWYKNEKRKKEDKKEKREFDEEFKRILLESIRIDKLRVNEIESGILNELSNIEISDYIRIMKRNKKRVKCLNGFSIEDEKVEELIIKYYKNEKEDIIKEEDLRVLKNEDIISMLLKSDNIKMKEIGLLILIESGTEYRISRRIKKEILIELIEEYKKNVKNKRILKCLCLFINDKRYIKAFVNVCGKEILYKMLNNECYLSKESKEMLIRYIQEMKVNEEEEEYEEEELLKIIENEELKEEIKTKEITSFSYPQSKYSFSVYEEVSVSPSFEGEKCNFSVTPSLPSGIILDRESGIICGRVEKRKRNEEYEVKCKNIRNEKKFKIALEFDEIKFTELNKGNGISISNNGKLITKIKDGFYHSYLNLKLENGIYHIKYQFHQNHLKSDGINLGLSTNNSYSGEDIYNKPTVCNYYAWNGKSQDITDYCHIGTIVNSNPNFNNHGDDSIYEIIVDMNKREFWISHNNSSPVLLVKDLPSPLYPYALPNHKNTSIELLSVSHQN